MTGEMHKADAAARLRLIKWLITIVLAGLVLLIFAEDLAGGITNWTFGDPDRAAGRVTIFVAGLCALTVLPLALIVAYLLRYAAAIMRAGRYPPPDWPVARDTRVLHGSSALNRARVLRMLATIVGLLGLIMVYFYWRLWNVLEALPSTGPTAV